MLRKTMKLAVLIAALLLLVVAAACGSGDSNGDGGEAGPGGVGQRVEVDGGSYVDISVPELRSMLEQKDFLLVNVFVPYMGDIEGTDLSIPFDEIADNVDQLPAQLDAKIVVYCRSGNKSATASTALVELGYTNVYNLAGGMNAWKAAGHALVLDGQ